MPYKIHTVGRQILWLGCGKRSGVEQVHVKQRRGRHGTREDTATAIGFASGLSHWELTQRLLEHLVSEGT